MQNNIKILSKSALFRGVEEQDMLSMLKCLGATERSYQKGDILLMAGTKAIAIGILIDGAAQITRDDADGGRAILSELDKADIFAEAYAAAGYGEVPITVIAAKPCRVVWIPFEKLTAQCVSSCEYHKILIENLLKVIAGKNIAMNERMRIFSCRTIRQKLLTYLRDYSDYAGSARFKIPFNRSELADYLSVDRSALSRELGKLKYEGVVEFSGNEFKLVE